MRLHRIVVLKHRVQPDDCHPLRPECLMHFFGQRQAMRHTAGAKHLESFHQHHLPTQIRQVQRVVGIEPAGHLPLGKHRV